MTRDEGPIEAFLDELYRQLSCAPRVARRLLAEAEAHLHDSAAAIEATGVDRETAEQRAVDRFGAPGRIAAQAPTAPRRPVPLALALVRAAVALAGVGLVAVGLSGAVAAVMNAAFGSSFVGAVHQTYSGAQCRHLLAVQPSAVDCAHAAILENSSDAVSLRLLAGAAGVLLLAVAWFWRRASGAHAWSTGLPPAVLPAVGLSAFGAAALWLTGQTLDLALLGGSDGTGFYLSGAVVALAGCVGFAIPLARELRDQPA